ncbi:hypothetical protein [Planctomicrobium piriforme]|uniref:Uncharacterized protein n=1 Tax=Planctomicrobium piriforme TaxID=1576369 RepID=A0A1I3K4W3_9PLAN|nr:hypothetical protein [Planctomicrobium piriforme]SFI67454.1 hypothetical protein SAMN05421753_111117 [Planctomicrobium piriforme]
MKQELMIPVEQTVRPIFASLERKMRMREELYSLLHDHWQTALDAGQSEKAALSQAVASFGSAAEIRHELQATVPHFERLAYGISIRLFSASQTPPFLEALRVGGSNAALLALIAFSVIWPTSWLRGEQFLSTARFLILQLCLFYGVCSAGTVWLGGRAVADLESDQQWSAIFKAIMGGLLFAGSYGLFSWGGAEQGLSSAVMLRMLGGGISYVVVFLLVCRELRKERQMTRPWLSLTWNR